MADFVTLPVSRNRHTGTIWCGRGVKAPDRVIAVAIVGRAGAIGSLSDTEDFGPWSDDLPRESLEAGAMLLAAKHGCSFGEFA